MGKNVFSFSVVLASLWSCGVLCGDGHFLIESDTSIPIEVGLGQLVGAQHSATFSLWQGVEGRCTDVSGVFVQGSIGREFDRREEVHQRTTTFRSGAIGREWVYNSPQARTHYGVAVSYTKNRSNFQWPFFVEEGKAL